MVMDTHHLALTLEELENLRSTPAGDLVQRMGEYGLSLPEFVRSTLPAAGHSLELSYSDGSYKSSLHPEKTYATLKDAYDDREEVDLVSFQESIRESAEPGIKFLPRRNDSPIFGVFVQQEDSENSYLLRRGRSEEERRYSDYLAFLIAYRTWESEPNIGTAWQFVALHPVFWHKSPAGVHNPQWVLSSGWEHATFSVSSDPDGHCALIASGGYSAEHSNYTERYADFLLEVSAQSMDDAILLFAERVYEVFGLKETENKGFKQMRESIWDNILNREA